MGDFVARPATSINDGLKVAGRDCGAKTDLDADRLEQPIESDVVYSSSGVYGG